MSAAATIPTPAATPDPNPPGVYKAGVDKGSRVGRLLGLVRRLIDYGKELAASFQPRSFAADPRFAPFGTSDVLQILANIRRGLHRANALEARLLRGGACLDARPRPPTAPSQRIPLSPGRTLAGPGEHAAQADSHFAHLPTVEQIAAAVRRRPVGAVIADICRDLGIMPNHPLWPELSQVILEHGGNLAALVKYILERAHPTDARNWPATGPAALPGPFRPTPLPASTGPP